jgi:hypothetical protein
MKITKKMQATFKRMDKLNDADLSEIVFKQWTASFSIRYVGMSKERVLAEQDARKQIAEALAKGRESFYLEMWWAFRLTHQKPLKVVSKSA